MEASDTILHPGKVADGLTTGPMSGLPDEMVRRVLSFLTIDSVMSAMRVDKKWEKAARYDVKHRKQLSIRGRRCHECKEAAFPCQSCRKKRFSDGAICMDTKNHFPVLCFIMKMQRLEELDVSDIPVQTIGLLVIQNAKTLRVVRGISKLPVAAPHVYEKLVELECSDFDEETVTACPNLSVLKIRDEFAVSEDEDDALNHPLPSILFPKLVSFKIHAECEREANDFVALHAHQLKRMRCYGMYPLEYNGREVIYYQLEKATVHLHDMEEEEACVLKNCPKLQCLKVLGVSDDADLSLLPTDSMQSLSLSFLDAVDEGVTKKAFKNLAKSVSRLQNLKKFKIQTPLQVKLLTGKNRKHYDILVPMFDGVHQLEDVSLSVAGGVVEMDDLIHRLVRGNPFLQTLSLSGIRVTDPVIDSMSRLPNLQSLKFSLNSPGLEGQHITTKSLVKLTTGASGTSLKRLQVDRAVEVDLDQVEEAFVLMLTARGLTPDHKNWKKDRENGDLCFC